CAPRARSVVLVASAAQRRSPLLPYTTLFRSPRAGRTAPRPTAGRRAREGDRCARDRVRSARAWWWLQWTWSTPVRACAQRAARSGPRGGPGDLVGAGQEEEGIAGLRGRRPPRRLGGWPPTCVPKARRARANAPGPQGQGRNGAGW